jgi:hypothetical protein
VCRRAILVGLCGFALAGGMTLARAQPAAAFPNPLDALSGVANVLCKGVGLIGEGWMGKACGAAVTVGQKAAKVAGLAKSVASNPATQAAAGGAVSFAGLTGWVGAAAVWALHKAGGIVGGASEPNVHASFFQDEYGRMIGLAALLALPMLVLAVIEGVLRSNWDILRRALISLPSAFLISALAATLVGIGLALTDAMGSSAAATAIGQAQSFFNHAAIVLGVALAAAGAAGHFLSGHAPHLAFLVSRAPLFVLFIGALYGFMAAGAVLIELLLREVAIFVALLFLPLVMAARIWPRLSHWGRDLTEGLTALVLSKFAIVAVLALAASLSASWNPIILLVALALLTVAAFTPVWLFRLVRFVDHSWHQHSAVAGQAMQAQTVSGAQLMRRTFMAHNPGHRIDPTRTALATGAVRAPGEGAGGQAVEGPEAAVAKTQARSAERVREASASAEQSDTRTREASASPSTGGETGLAVADRDAAGAGPDRVGRGVHGGAGADPRGRSFAAGDRATEPPDTRPPSPRTPRPPRSTPPSPPPGGSTSPGQEEPGQGGGS